MFENHQEASVNSRVLALVTGCLVLIAGCTGSTNGKNAKGTATPAEPTVVATFNLTDDESDNFVTAVCWANGFLWAGTEHAVFQVSYDEAAKSFELVKKHSAAIEDARVNTIRADGTDIVVASTEGYSRYHDDGWVRQAIGNTNDLLTVGDSLWSATNSGIEILKNGSREWRKFEVSSATDYSPTRKMTSLASDGTKSVWVGTEFGLHHFDLAAYDDFMGKLRPGAAGTAVPSGSFWRRYYGDYQNPSGGVLANEQGNCPLSGNFVRHITFADQHFFFCTDRGMTTYDGKSWTAYVGTSMVGIPGEGGRIDHRPVEGNVPIPTPEVFDAVSHGGRYYLATLSGVAAVAPDRSSTTLITMTQGLPSDRVRSLTVDGATGTLFVGTENGLAAISL